MNLDNSGRSVGNVVARRNCGTVARCCGFAIGGGSRVRRSEAIRCADFEFATRVVAGRAPIRAHITRPRRAFRLRTNRSLACRARTGFSDGCGCLNQSLEPTMADISLDDLLKLYQTPG